MKTVKNSLLPALLIFALGLTVCSADRDSGNGSIHPDAERKEVTLSDGQGQLVLRLNYDKCCVLDQVIVRGREVAGESGIFTGVSEDGQWFTTKNIATPRIFAGKDALTVTGIQFGPPGAEIRESWRFMAQSNQIVWRITRKYPANAVLEDAAFPEWDFSGMSTWTGGLLDNGGIIWNKYLDKTNATYGAHFGTVTFWNSQSNDCLRIIPDLPDHQFGAGRFSRQGNGVFSFNYTVSSEELRPKYKFRRFLDDQQDLWLPFRVKRSEVNAQFTLKALDYSRADNRGNFHGLDGNLVRELLNTVPRYGVIDKRLTGGNGWRTGWICLHEPFFAEMGLALDETDYIANLSQCLDFERDHAIKADGRVSARWRDRNINGNGSHTIWPDRKIAGNGSDAICYYEPGRFLLLDSQPDYVINVAEQFNLTGDRKWIAGQKSACEKALNFLMRREVPNTGLVAMMSDSTRQQKCSDWIDVIYASYENAFVNAALYEALKLWANAEDTLKDPSHATTYRAFAARLKTTFNLPIAGGGFWDPTNQWYVYWRDKDNSIHGDNLVTPVNFAAIAYGLCDDESRRKAILDRMENEMRKEKLFSWPLNFFPYQPEEGGKINFPFPRYENGDLFLSWDELGVRAYAAYDPAIAVKYIRNILTRYGEDGLSFQRYLRKSQNGAGNDILAGNCMAIVGLYRDIYGIQPKPNRLYLEPHLTDDLNGTRLRYELRGQLYLIDLNTKGSAITAGNCALRDSHPFGINAIPHGLEYFSGTNADWAMSVSRANDQPLTIQINSWLESPDAPRQWTETVPQAGGKTYYRMVHLRPGAIYELKINGQTSDSLRADKTGCLNFTRACLAIQPQHFELVPTLLKN
ncbi:MAG TPA: hypothetical protein VH280_11105 [Verrucomicrobiae bacterium]|nr:hypothetical protein [Verrucomicrobiae bacterium]